MALCCLGIRRSSLLLFLATLLLSLLVPGLTLSLLKWFLFSFFCSLFLVCCPYCLCSYHMMQQCWRRYASDRPHFEHIVNVLTTFLDRLKRPDSIYNSDSESDDDPEGNHARHGSGKLPARTPSIRSGKGKDKYKTHSMCFAFACDCQCQANRKCCQQLSVDLC